MQSDHESNFTRFWNKVPTLAASFLQPPPPLLLAVFAITQNMGVVAWSSKISNQNWRQLGDESQHHTSLARTITVKRLHFLFCFQLFSVSNSYFQFSIHFHHYMHDLGFASQILLYIIECVGFVYIVYTVLTLIKRMQIK